jgi:TatD DNase family protein
MTEFFDTHAHLDFPDFEADLREVVARAGRAGVTRIVTIGTTLEGSRRAVALAERFPGVFAAVGVHPGHVDESPDEIRDPLRRLAAHPKVVAIGETGLDFFRRPGSEPVPADLVARNRDRQESLFRQQLEVAGELGLPVVVHTRDSFRPTMDLLHASGCGVRAVFHCWVGRLEEAMEVVAAGSLVSFTGIASFKNGAAIRAVAAALPAGTFQLETDCPFLAPVPHRGRRCEPAHVADLAPVLAEARGISVADLSMETCATALRFFHRMS